MARARNIKPSFFTSEQVADNCPLGRLLFIGLWTEADFRGNVEWKPRTLKVKILPFDDCDIEKLAINLDKSGLIQFYSANDKKYINIPNFEKHQNPHKNEREKGSSIPDFQNQLLQVIDSKELTINRDKNGSNRDENGTHPADSLFLIPVSCFLIPENLNPISEKILPQKNLRSERFTEFWEAYPATDRRTAKKQCLEKWQKNNLDEQADLIVAHVDEMKRTEQWKNGYEPAALTYINQKRWDGFGDCMHIPNRSNSEKQNNSIMQHSKSDLDDQAKRIAKMLANKNPISSQEF